MDEAELNIYLSEIAERLNACQASLLVGAGLSKNVKKGESTSKNFPSWNDLGDCFFRKLYGRDPKEEEKNYLNVLKLAEEVEAYYDRNSVDEILQATIPDKEVNPSEIHEKLVQLPWTDIFTTNYDTLLERAADKIIRKEEAYKVIVNKADLPLSSRPRIVKLHGSFPSQRPFIITQEDYRKYPKDNAPFVNIVRQSLMENYLCLIGFSGNDPNFLQWIGWVRDNLEAYAPAIFFIGFSISKTERKWMEKKNIKAIDISCMCKPKAEVNDYNDDKKLPIPPETESYYEALLEFVTFLQHKVQAKQKKNIPGVGENKLEYPKEKSFFHIDLKKEIQPQFKELIRVWKGTRELYPNWLILPKESR